MPLSYRNPIRIVSHPSGICNAMYSAFEKIPATFKHGGSQRAHFMLPEMREPQKSEGIYPSTRLMSRDNERLLGELGTSSRRRCKAKGLVRDSNFPPRTALFS